MAVNVNVIGRLGADAEMREGKNGSKYAMFRLATDEFRNGNRETTWMTVYDYSERAQKMVQYWKKGSMVNVIGVESVSPYQSKESGTWLVSRDIRAFNVDFVNSGNNVTSGATATTTTATQTNQNTSNMMGTFTQPMPTPQVEQSFVATSSDDITDLPF